MISLSDAPIETRYGYADNAGDRLLKTIQNPQAARSYGYQRQNSLITQLTETQQEHNTSRTATIVDR